MLDVAVVGLGWWGRITVSLLAGRHVFCEKPPALTRADAKRALAACEAASVVLGVGHERRFEPGIAELQRLLAAGDLGRPLPIEANFSQDKFLDMPSDNGRLSAAEAPGGPLTATGIHLVDLSVSVFGQPEQPEGWVLTHCIRGGKPQRREIPPASAVLANLESFAEAGLGGAPYPVPHSEMLATVSALEAITCSAASGKAETIDS